MSSTSSFLSRPSKIPAMRPRLGCGAQRDTKSPWGISTLPRRTPFLFQLERTPTRSRNSPYPAIAPTHGLGLGLILAFLTANWRKCPTTKSTPPNFNEQAQTGLLARVRPSSTGPRLPGWHMGDFGKYSTSRKACRRNRGSSLWFTGKQATLQGSTRQSGSLIGEPHTDCRGEGAGGRQCRSPVF